MSGTGKHNALTDVSGIAVGHYTDLNHVSGVTVVLCLNGATAGVDVRGAAPGTRETDLLLPENLVEKVHAIVLSGGSVFGLSAADGVVQWLARRGVGFPLEEGHVAPIVPAATLFDLGRGPEYVQPIEPGWGVMACEAASDGPAVCGCVGAGTGALAGGVKGGVGTASEVLESGLVVAALVAVNSLGSVIDPATGLPWEVRLELDNEFGEFSRIAVRVPEIRPARVAENTTIGVVATDATLTKAQARKVAQMAHDGLARAIRPAHTMVDGDTLFCLATGIKELPDTPSFFAAPKVQALTEIGRAAADCTSRAVIRALFEATSLEGMKSFRDLERR
ncbi:MAG: P1 family peptidase [Desulfomonile sp.]|nr:P1 family peptidase [Desulfomonile sp.]